MDIRQLIEPKVNENIPQLFPGDTARVSLRVKEGDKERVQHFQGMVIRIRRGVDGGRFTLRRVAYGVGVEYTIPFSSPQVDGVEVLRRGKARRAKLYYMRDLSAKKARLKEKRSDNRPSESTENDSE
ncbi:MAG: 50S ribosomal protein L19 [Dehalococcoidia bacterium]|nr:50S ribosomal protein L19 [Dehalococcoidia bacterium]